jgi:hypothetical protein
VALSSGVRDTPNLRCGTHNLSERVSKSEGKDRRAARQNLKRLASIALRRFAALFPDGNVDYSEINRAEQQQCCAANCCPFEHLIGDKRP